MTPEQDEEEGRSTMMPLMDMLMKMQNGEALQEFSRQFQLSQEQTRAAIEALLPAFSQGLKRNAYDPWGAGKLLGTLASGQHSQFFDHPMSAFTADGLKQGNDILGQLFGSKDLSRAIATQAEQATGIAQEIFKQMMPALASVIMGGLQRQSTEQFGGSGAGPSENPFAELMWQMMRQSGMSGRASQTRRGGETAANPFDNPFMQAFQQMMASSGTAPGEKPDAGMFSHSPFAEFFERMVNAGTASGESNAAEARTNPSGRPRNPYDDFFGKMFESGREVRDEYQKGMEKIFDQYLKGMQKPQ
jgi:hypothetical protein